MAIWYSKLYNTLILVCFMNPYPSLYIPWSVAIGIDIVFMPSWQPPWMSTLIGPHITFSEYILPYPSCQGQSWYLCLVGCSIVRSYVMGTSRLPHGMRYRRGGFHLDYHIPWSHHGIYSFAPIGGDYEYIFWLRMCVNMRDCCVGSISVGPIVGSGRSVF